MPEVQQGNQNRIAALFISVLILSYPINIEIILIFRPLDILLWFFCLYSLISISPRVLIKSVKDSTYFPLILLFITSLLLSLAYGLIVHGVKEPNNLVFIYKYIQVFALFWVLGIWIRGLTDRQILFLISVFMLAFLLMVLNVFSFTYFPLEAMHQWAFHSATSRPSFPFSNQFFADAHIIAGLLSNVMTLLVALMFFYSFTVLYQIVCIAILIPSFIALLLTGSRAGLLVTILSIGLIVCMKLPGLRASRKHNRQTRTQPLSIVWIIAVFIVISILLVMAIFQLYQNPDTRFFVARLVSLDNLVGSRLDKILYAVDKVILNGAVLIGIGAVATHQIFYDNALASLLVNAGILGIICFGGLVYQYMMKVYREELSDQITNYYVFLAVLMNYVLINVTCSEFFLITRSIFPFTIGILLTIQFLARFPSKKWLSE